MISGGILGLLLFIFHIYVLFLILTSSSTVGTKLLWALIVIFVPLLGPILYLIIGRKGAL